MALMQADQVVTIDAEGQTDTQRPPSFSEELEKRIRGRQMLERVLYWLFPRLLLQETPYHDEWFDRERTENVRFWRVLFPVIALIYLGHYYLFDLPQGLQPAELWFQFRMTIVGLCVATTVSYFIPSVARSPIYRLPAALTILVCCYTQARTIIWYDHSQYLYAFIFVVVGTTFLRTTVLWSVCFALIALIAQWPSLRETGTPVAAAYSGAVATLLFVITARSKYAGDVRYFLANQRYISSQKRMIEMNIEFSDRIRAFLPKEISGRLAQHLSENRLTVLQAVDQVLAPAGRQIACLFTDIRGFTKGTKQSDSFIFDGVIPNVGTCSGLIEKHRGIPRKVGDLLFAYFDDRSIYTNLIRCLLAAADIVDANLRFNRNNEQQIRRFVLVSTGSAVVGNLGGYDSSIEITALVSPVNLLSRIDELTKTARFRDYSTENDIVLCPNTATLLQRLELYWNIKRLGVAELGTVIRDFEEVDSVWVFPIDDHNRRVLLATDSVIKLQH